MTTPIETAEPWGTEETRQASYDAELIRRYQEGLPLTKADAKAARRLIKEQQLAERVADEDDREEAFNNGQFGVGA